jgi:uncharacterized protein YgiM (DUF1202 family)
MKKQLFRTAVCILTLALLFSVPGAFAASTANVTRGYVTANTMPVYQYPNPFSKLLGTMSYGEDVNVLAWQDGWMKLQNHKGQIGYCEIGSLSRNNPAMEVFGYVKEAGAYVYSKPSPEYKVIAKVTMGDELKVVGMTQDKTWLRVQNGSKYGYVLRELMSKTPIWPDDAFASLV